MAQTKASTAKPSGGKKPGKRSSGTVRKASSKHTKAGSQRSKTRAKAKRPVSRSSSSNGGSSNKVSDGAKAVRESLEGAGQKAGRATSEVAGKAKIPLIAGGAAVVGAASGLALGASRSRSGKVLGVRMPKTKVKIRSKDLLKSADRVARAGEQIGRLSTGLREIQGTSGSSNGNGGDRSPIEVVLQGLTRRR
jgi:hypothetical protein